MQGEFSFSHSLDVVDEVLRRNLNNFEIIRRNKNVRSPRAVYEFEVAFDVLIVNPILIEQSGKGYRRCSREREEN